MTPEEQQAAQAKRDREDKILRTRSIVGSKQERLAFRQEKKGIQRQRALDKMTPAQREKALNAEAAKTAKADQAKAAKAAQAQRRKDDKTLRTKSIVGTKAERVAFKADKARIERERMSPEQRAKALKAEQDQAAKEAAVKAAKEADKKRQEEAKLARQKSKVGTKEERAKWRSEKERQAREQKLAAMTPEQRDRYLAREKAQEEARASATAREAFEKKVRTRAVVGDKQARQEFRDFRRSLKDGSAMLEPMPPPETPVATTPPPSTSNGERPRSSPSVSRNSNAEQAFVCAAQAAEETRQMIALIA